LYSARVKAPYRGGPLTTADSTDSLITAQQVLQLMATDLGLPQGGMTPMKPAPQELRPMVWASIVHSYNPSKITLNPAVVS
jgi:hypothetical protein